MDTNPESGCENLSPPLLGCVADDFTGATDLARILALNGMRTTVELGLPESAPTNVEAIVIALKRAAPGSTMLCNHSLLHCGGCVTRVAVISSSSIAPLSIPLRAKTSAP